MVSQGGGLAQDISVFFFSRTFLDLSPMWIYHDCMKAENPSSGKGVSRVSRRRGKVCPDSRNMGNLTGPQLKILFEILDQLTSAMERRKSIQACLVILGKRFGWDRVTLYRFLPDDRSVEAWLSSDAPMDWQAQLNLTRYPELQAARTERNPIFVPRVSQDVFLKDSRDRLASTGFVSLYVQPLHNNVTCWGALSLKSKSRHEKMTGAEEAILPLVANLFSQVFPVQVASPVARQTIATLYASVMNLIRKASNGYAILSTSGTIIEVGGNFTEKLGYRIQDVMGKRVTHFLDPQDHMKVLDLLAGLGGEPGNISQQTITMLDERGSRIRLLATVMADPLHSDRVISIVTYQNPDESLNYFLNQFKNTLRKLIWDAPNYVYIIDSDGRFLAVNKALCDVTGYTEQEFLARSFSGIIPHEERALSEKRIERLLKGEELLPRIGHFETRKSGLIPVEIQVHSISDEQGSIVAMMGIARDLRAFMASKEREEHLRRELNRQIQELSRVNTQLEEERGFRYTFISAAAHQIKTPISTLKACLETLMTDFHAKLPPQTDELLQPAWQSILRVEGLINDLLELSGLQSRQIPGRKERFDLHDLISELDGMVRPLIKKHQIGFAVHCPDKIWIDSDRARVNQVLDTLIINAIHACPKKSDVSLTVEDQGDRVQIHVHNPGPPLSEERLKTLFIPFLQTSSRDGRHGLGLALAKSIVEVLGGEIVVTSDTENGTTFTLELPCHEAE